MEKNRDLYLHGIHEGSKTPAEVKPIRAEVRNTTSGARELDPSDLDEPIDLVDEIVEEPKKAA